jgi:hypothetical protein
MNLLKLSHILYKAGQAAGDTNTAVKQGPAAFVKRRYVKRPIHRAEVKLLKKLKLW